jgi:hypothetical protein
MSSIHFRLVERNSWEAEIWHRYGEVDADGFAALELLVEQGNSVRGSSYSLQKLTPVQRNMAVMTGRRGSGYQTFTVDLGKLATPALLALLEKIEIDHDPLYKCGVENAAAKVRLRRKPLDPDADILAIDVFTFGVSKIVFDAEKCETAIEYAAPSSRVEIVDEHPEELLRQLLASGNTQPFLAVKRASFDDCYEKVSL